MIARLKYAVRRLVDAIDRAERDSLIEQLSSPSRKIDAAPFVEKPSCLSSGRS